MAEILLDQVNKVYPGGVQGVDDLNLEIKDAAFMVPGPPPPPGARGSPRERPAVHPRRQAPGVDAGVPAPAARAPRRPPRVRDPRPGRGHDPRAPGVRTAGWPAAAGRHAADPVRRPG